MTGRGRERPRLPKGEAKATFTVRLSAEERAAIDAAAKRAGKPVTQWAREALVAAGVEALTERVSRVHFTAPLAVRPLARR